MPFKSIKKKSLDQGINRILRIIASLLVALSGFILYADKVLTLQLQNNHGYSDTQTFIWVLMQSISPVLLIVVGAFFKPYKIFYTIPLYFYTIQIYWVFDSSLQFDDALLQLYAVGTVFTFIISSILLNFVLSKLKSQSQSKISFLEQALDLSVTLNNQPDNEK